MGIDEEAKPYEIPTRDSFTFSKEHDGGFTINIQLKRATFDALTKNHRDTLQQIAALLLTMKSDLEGASSPKPASVFD